MSARTTLHSVLDRCFDRAGLQRFSAPLPLSPFLCRFPNLLGLFGGEPTP